MKTRWIALMMLLLVGGLLGLGLLLPSAAALTPVTPGQPGAEVEARAVAQKAKANPGEQIAIAIVLDYSEGWHSWPNFKPELPKGYEDMPVAPTEIRPLAKGDFPSGFHVSLPWTQWPKPHLSKVAGTQVLAFSDRTVAYVPVVIDAKTPSGKYTLQFGVAYQACNEDTCIQPNVLPVSATIEIVPIGETTKEADPALFVNFKPEVFGKILAGETVGEDWEFDFIGYKFKIRKDAYVLILGLAFIAGVLMNFTPCVLPVIPIKILSMQSHAKSPGKLVYLGMVYCAGVVLLYVLLGLLLFGLVTGGRKLDWGQQFSSAWFTGTLSLIVAGLGIAMMGGFALRLPNFVYMFNPTGDTVTGNLFGGLLTGILATPCTAPLVGAAVAWASAQPPMVGLLMITMMGVGMALPYAVLILFPKLLDRMPRGGPGGELLKQVMGLFMVAVAAYLAGNLFDGKWPWWVVGGVSIVASLWLVVGAWRLLRTQKAKIACTAIGLALAGSSYAVAASLADEGPLPWSRLRNKSDAMVNGHIDDAVKRGEVVVVDFTAKWCVNCQFLEKTVLNSADGIKLLTGEKVSLVRVDLTNSEPNEGWGVVRGISGGGGIPLIAIYGPGITKPVYFQSFFKVSDLEEAMKKARGG